MPGRQKTTVKGIGEARRKLKKVGRNAVQERTIVSAAKKAGSPTLSKMKANVIRSERNAVLLSRKLGIKKIPSKYGGRDFPGAFVGVMGTAPKFWTTYANKKSSNQSENTVLNLFWIEYGTEKRKTDTGRSTGRYEPRQKAPMRRALSSTYKTAFGAFRGKIVQAVNNRVRRNAL